MDELNDGQHYIYRTVLGAPPDMNEILLREFFTLCVAWELEQLENTRDNMEDEVSE